MHKRILSFLLILIFTCTPLMNLSITADAADANTQIASSVEQAYHELAAEIAIEDADTEGTKQLLDHAQNGGGKDLYMDEDDPFTAMAFHAGMCKEGTIKALTSAFQTLSRSGDDKLFIRGVYMWYHDKSTYSHFSYNDNENGDDSDDQRISTLVSERFYDGINANDEALYYVGGSVNSRISITKLDTTDESITYQVDMQLNDEFDFNADYTSSNRALAILITAFGKLLESGLGAIESYYWETNVEFQITIPNLCTHQSANYRWEHDGTDFVNVVAGDDLPNDLTMIQTQKEDGTYYAPYYRTDQIIRLNHDRPWVLEQRTKGSTGFMLAPSSSYSSGLPYILRTPNLIVGGYAVPYKEISEETGKEVTRYTRHQYGIDFSTHGIKSGQWHTYRLENRIAADGSNMVYLLIDGTEIGPMNQYFINTNSVNVDQGTTSDWFNGLDITLNYIGNNNFKVSPNVAYEYVQVWENGENGDFYSYLENTSTSASCHKDGVSGQICTLCDAAFGEVSPATGHIYENGKCYSCNMDECDPKDYIRNVAYVLVTQCSALQPGFTFEEEAGIGYFDLTIPESAAAALQSGDEQTMEIWKDFSELLCRVSARITGCLVQLDNDAECGFVVYGDGTGDKNLLVVENGSVMSDFTK